MLWVHIGITPMRQFQCVPTTYVTQNKETYFEIYTKTSIMSISFPLLNNMSLYGKLFIFNYDSYITKFDSMNYAFNKPVVAWK